MKKSCWLFIVIALFSSACSHTKELEYQKVQNFSMKQSSVCLDICLYNPNRYNLKLKDADVDVFMNGTRLGKLKLDGIHAVPKLDTFLLPVMLDVNLLTALPNALQLVMNSTVDIKLTGAIKAGRHGIYIHVPVNYEGQQDLLSSMKK